MEKRRSSFKICSSRMTCNKYLLPLLISGLALNIPHLCNTQETHLNHNTRAHNYQYSKKNRFLILFGYVHIIVRDTSLKHYNNTIFSDFNNRYSYRNIFKLLRTTMYNNPWYNFRLLRNTRVRGISSPYQCLKPTNS